MCPKTLSIFAVVVASVVFSTFPLNSPQLQDRKGGTSNLVDVDVGSDLAKSFNGLPRGPHFDTQGNG